MDVYRGGKVSAHEGSWEATFRHCLRARETSGLEAGTTHKAYAPGVGSVRDDEIVLVGFEKSSRE